MRRKRLTFLLTVVLTATAMLLPAAAQAAVVEQARNCVGAQVIRCGWIHCNTDNQRICGHASAAASR
jgi:hypothetical protein